MVTCKEIEIYNATGIWGGSGSGGWQYCTDENGNYVNPDGTPFQTPKPIQTNYDPFTNPYWQQQPVNQQPVKKSGIFYQLIIWLIVVVAVIILMQKLK